MIPGSVLYTAWKVTTDHAALNRAQAVRLPAMTLNEEELCRHNAGN
jgi:hypothetical protein